MRGPRCNGFKENAPVWHGKGLPWMLLFKQIINTQQGVSSFGAIENNRWRFWGVNYRTGRPLAPSACGEKGAASRYPDPPSAPRTRALTATLCTVLRTLGRTVHNSARSPLPLARRRLQPTNPSSLLPRERNPLDERTPALRDAGNNAASPGPAGASRAPSAQSGETRRLRAETLPHDARP